LWFERGQTNHHRKNPPQYEVLRRASDLVSLDRPEQRKIDMRFGTWNVRSLYRKCLLKAGASELAKYDLDREAIKGVRFVEGGCQPADDYIHLHGNGNANYHLGKDIFVHKGIISAEKWVKLISDRMSYIL